MLLFGAQEVHREPLAAPWQMINHINPIHSCRCHDDFRRPLAKIEVETFKKPTFPRIGGARKHDIRQWVIVTSLNPLVIHFFSECQGPSDLQKVHMRQTHQETEQE